MEVVIVPTPHDVSHLTAGIVARLVRDTPTAVLGLATGKTPLGVYQELVRMHREDGLDLSRCTTFNLDEYVGLDHQHPSSYRRYMAENFFNHVNIPRDNIHMPDGMVENVPRYCMLYERTISEAGGIDLQLLGIGEDGHIGFNEPTSSLGSRTRLKTLTDGTTFVNQVFFKSGDFVPRHVITMGVGTILEARRCIMMAFGASKAHAVAAMIEGPVASFCPASALQLHPDTVAVIDEDTARELKLAAYYQNVYRNKPAWQRLI